MPALVIVLGWLMIESVNGAGMELAVPVSPGSADRPTVVDSRCPSFSWAHAPGAVGYELAVYEVPEAGQVDVSRPNLFERLPAGALSWTPGRARCLAAGQSFVWFVRPLYEEVASDWSAGRLFRTPTAPSRHDVFQALEVIQSFLDHGGSLDEIARAERADPGPGTARRRAASQVGGSREREACQLSGQSDHRVGKNDDRGTLVNVTSQATVPSAMVSATRTGAQSATAVVRGVALFPDEEFGGYLGVQGGDNYDFDLIDIEGDEIGLLGVSISDFGGADNAADNFGVVGIVASNLATPDGPAAGYFKSVYHNNGAPTGIEVYLGQPHRAMTATGEVHIDGPLAVTGELSIRVDGATYTSEGNATPEVYKLDDMNAPQCAVGERGTMFVGRPSLAANQDALCICMNLSDVYDWWCFNP